MLPTTRRRGGISGARNLWSEPFEALQHEFDRMLNRAWDGGTPATREMIGEYPVDIREDEDHIYVDAELPGFRQDEVEVTLEAGVLTIKAERHEEEAEEKATQHLNERVYRRVQRSFTVPSSVDESHVEAKLRDGVLCLKLMKREEVKPRRIPISAGE